MADQDHIADLVANVQRTIPAPAVEDMDDTTRRHIEAAARYHDVTVKEYLARVKGPKDVAADQEAAELARAARRPSV